eukprot:Hpha_TRINITY_DN8371_c0_g1::TRINITY_DN8371_c0_g1_i1::g.154186::m.154186
MINGAGRMSPVVMLAIVRLAASSCLEGWESVGETEWDGQRCFLRTEYRGAQMTALCSTSHPDAGIASVRSSAEFALAKRLAANSAGAWTALRWGAGSVDGDDWSGWYWTDSTAVSTNAMQWSDGEPSRMDIKRSCALITEEGLQVSLCSDSQNHLCSFSPLHEVDLRLPSIKLSPDDLAREYRTLHVGTTAFAVCFLLLPPGDTRFGLERFGSGGRVVVGTQPAVGAGGKPAVILSKGSGNTEFYVAFSDPTLDSPFPSVEVKVGPTSVRYGPVDWSAPSHWIVQRNDVGVVELFRDGRPVSRLSSRSPIHLGSDPLVVGARSSQKGKYVSVNGTLRDLLVYHRTLTTPEVYTLAARSSFQFMGAGECADRQGLLMPGFATRGVGEAGVCKGRCLATDWCVGVTWQPGLSECTLHYNGLVTPEPTPTGPTKGLEKTQVAGGE